MDRVFQIVAVILAGIAAYFLWTGNKDGAFVSAVLGCVAFFLSVRVQVKERRGQREEEERALQEESTDQHEPLGGDQVTKVPEKHSQ